ncbi:MAG: polysulfide reductase NrfD [Thermoleophilia bacterium]|nr:polysulfide reductase NrfD [Thermoleophilia bacterium]
MAHEISSEAAGAQVYGEQLAGIDQAIRKTTYWVALLGMAILFVVGVAAGIHAKSIGSLHAFNATREVPWGILISTYVYLVVVADGVCLVSSIGHVFGRKDFVPLASRSVFLAVATLLGGFFVIFFDIENPFRMAIYNVISPNLTSAIWWMGTLYGALMFFMGVEFVFLLKGKHKLATAAGFLGVIAGVAALSNLGAVFGSLDGRDFWYGPFMPIFFIASAMMSGAAAIIFFTLLAYKLSNRKMEPAMKRALEVTAKVGILLIVTTLFFTLWKLIIGLTGGEAKTLALRSLLSGHYAVNFWILEITVGMVIPLVLLVLSKGRSLWLMAVAATLMMFGIFFMRYDMVIVGQTVPVQFQLGVSEYAGLISYAPSTHEILISLGGIGLAGLIFLAGEKIFKGHKSETH